MHICFLSNGYGEDRSAALIARELLGKRPDVSVSAAPLITSGSEYEKRAIPVLTKGDIPPSGGFPTLGAKAFIQDLAYNRRHFEYYRTLKPLRSRIDALVTVGDTFLLVLGYLSLGKGILHISLSKSEYKNSHFWFEELIFKRASMCVLTRDACTSRKLHDKGVKALYLGNPIMDDLAPKGVYVGGETIVGLLPGSKLEGYRNFSRMMDVVNCIDDEVDFALALSPHLDMDRMIKTVLEKGWRAQEGAFTKGRQSLRMFSDAFEDVIARARVVISLAGTASEQAAGLGKPIVSFTGSGTQSNLRRMKDQERLLGGAVKHIADVPRGVAAEVSLLLADSNERQRRGRIGMERMGRAGAANRIAQYVIDAFEREMR